MKFKNITAIALCAMAIISCDEDTATIGDSLTNEHDRLVSSTHEFNVYTRSVAVDSVFSRERQCYFGKVKDPETDSYVKSEFTTQFNMMEDIGDDLPEKQQFIDASGEVMADSCIIYVQFDVSANYGDTLAAMKMKVSELDKPINTVNMHYSNFDPKSAGMIRNNGISKQHMFTISDLTVNDTTAAYRWSRIYLNDPYTAKDGRTYSNYGSYLLNTYYDHRDYFKNSYTFVNKVCPGFFFELTDGLGVMAKVAQVDLYTYYHFKSDTTIYHSYLRTTSTEEVVQTIKVTNDKAAIKELVADDNCTYLKTPAGIFTEVTLPVDEVHSMHTTDSLLSVKISFNRINNETDAKDLAFKAPAKIILIEKDSLDSFFVGNNLENNIYAFKASLASNAYTFGNASNNISNLITRMYRAKEKGMQSDSQWTAKHPDWNKALLVPIDETTIETTSSSSYYSYYYYSTPTTTSTAVALKNQMGLTSTKLVKGTETAPIKMEVIYAKFKD